MLSQQLLEHPTGQHTVAACRMHARALPRSSPIRANALDAAAAAGQGEAQLVCQQGIQLVRHALAQAIARPLSSDHAGKLTASAVRNRCWKLRADPAPE